MKLPALKSEVSNKNLKYELGFPSNPTKHTQGPLVFSKTNCKITNILQF